MDYIQWCMKRCWQIKYLRKNGEPNSLAELWNYYYGYYMSSILKDLDNHEWEPKQYSNYDRTFTITRIGE